MLHFRYLFERFSNQCPIDFDETLYEYDKMYDNIFDVNWKIITYVSAVQFFEKQILGGVSTTAH